jgi:prevent-host-death family protein
MRQIPLSEAKALFSDCIRAVEQGEFLIVTRHEKPVAAIVRPENIEQLERLRKAGPEGGLASLAGGWEDSSEVLQVLGDSPRTSFRVVPEVEE